MNEVKKTILITALIILPLIAILIFAFNQVDWASTNAWLKQPITSLSIEELMIIIVFIVIIFSNGKGK